jgi:hypothetical protein
VGPPVVFAATVCADLCGRAAFGGVALAGAVAGSSSDVALAVVFAGGVLAGVSFALGPAGVLLVPAAVLDRVPESGSAAREALWSSSARAAR